MIQIEFVISLPHLSKMKLQMCTLRAGSSVCGTGERRSGEGIGNGLGRDRTWQIPWSHLPIRLLCSTLLLMGLRVVKGFSEAEWVSP